MARPSRFGVLIAVICIVLIVLFLAVKDLGRFTTHLAFSSLRALRALPEEISLLVAVVVPAMLISCKGESESCFASSGLAPWSIPTNLSFSALRC